MDFDNELENIDEYYSNDEDENYEESDAESETETDKKPKLTIGGALSDDENEEEEAEVIEKDENDEEEVEDEEVEESDEENEDEEEPQTATKEKKVKKVLPPIVNSDDEDDNGDEDDEGYLQKFDKEINNNYILNIHPECKTHNYDEIACLSKVVYNADGIIVDPLHRTIPILTKYERTRILGQRAKQINSGSKPFVKVPENIIDGYLIAEIELSQKRIPFIIRRPFPGGGCEYWNIKDLELID
jgi:DNA-directed RNA polymerase I, II, and III subunit RPABC2